MPVTNSCSLDMSILKTQLEQWLNSTMVRIIQILLEWCTTWYVLNHSLCFTSNCRVAGNVLESDCYIFKHVFWLNSADLLDITELIRVLFLLVGIKCSSEFAEGRARAAQLLDLYMSGLVACNGYKKNRMRLVPCKKWKSACGSVSGKQKIKKCCFKFTVWNYLTYVEL